MVRTLSFVLALAILTTGHASPALADHDTRGPEPMDPITAQIAREKRALSDLFALVLEGKAERARFEGRAAALLKRVGEDPALARGGRSGGFTILGHDQPGVNLGVAQSPQDNGVYCGPASGYSLLSYLGNWTSVYNSSHSLSQPNLAQTPYFRTTGAGTAWYTYPSDPDGSYPVPAGLNRWRVGSINGWYVPVAGGQGSLTTYKNDLRYDVGHMGYPLMGNTVEVAGGTRYNGHPASSSSAIYHWIVLDGYANYGDTTWYTDPAAYAASLGWPAQPYNSMASSTLWNSYLIHRGYVW